MYPCLFEVIATQLKASTTFFILICILLRNTVEIYDCVQLNYVVHHKTVPVIALAILQTIITAQMVSIRWEWTEKRRMKAD